MKRLQKVIDIRRRIREANDVAVVELLVRAGACSREQVTENVGVKSEEAFENAVPGAIRRNNHDDLG